MPSSTQESPAGQLINPTWVSILIPQHAASLDASTPRPIVPPKSEPPGPGPSRRGGAGAMRQLKRPTTVSAGDGAENLRRPVCLGSSVTCLVRRGAGLLGALPRGWQRAGTSWSCARSKSLGWSLGKPSYLEEKYRKRHGFGCRNARPIALSSPCAFQEDLPVGEEAAKVRWVWEKAGSTVNRPTPFPKRNRPSLFAIYSVPWQRLTGNVGATRCRWVPSVPRGA